MTEVDATTEGSVQLLDASASDDARLLAELLADPTILDVDSWATQKAALHRLRPSLGPELLDETPRFAYYPW